MRHRSHRHVLGVKTAHRRSLIASLAASLFINARITTTLSRARALRPFAEKVITLAKKAAQATDKSAKLHYYRLALSRVRNEQACRLLFKDERVGQFLARSGGYTRIYKIGARKGDAAETALIELVGKDDKAPVMTPKAKAVRKPKAAQAEAAAAQA
jgi:large subunit ribosomal protein L17